MKLRERLVNLFIDQFNVFVVSVLISLFMLALLYVIHYEKGADDAVTTMLIDAVKELRGALLALLSASAAGMAASHYRKTDTTDTVNSNSSSVSVIKSTDVDPAQAAPEVVAPPASAPKKA